LKKLADDKKQYPKAAQVLSNDSYVDDLLSGSSTIEDATKVQKEISLLRTADIEKVGIQPLYILGYHSKGAARNTANIIPG